MIIRIKSNDKLNFYNWRLTPFIDKGGNGSNNAIAKWQLFFNYYVLVRFLKHGFVVKNSKDVLEQNCEHIVREKQAIIRKFNTVCSLPLKGWAYSFLFYSKQKCNVSLKWIPLVQKENK